MICSKDAFITDPVVAEAVGNASGHLASWHTISRRYEAFPLGASQENPAGIFGRDMQPKASLPWQVTL